MKLSFALLLGLTLQYVRATSQPSAFTQSRCLTAYTSKSVIPSRTTTAYTLTFYQSVVYTVTPSKVLTPPAATSKFMLDLLTWIYAFHCASVMHNMLCYTLCSCPDHPEDRPSARWTAGSPTSDWHRSMAPALWHLNCSVQRRVTLIWGRICSISAFVCVRSSSDNRLDHVLLNTFFGHS